MNARYSLSECEGKKIMNRYGIKVPAHVVAKNVEGVLELVEKLSPPYVVKVVSSEILHKSDAGGVALDIESPKKVVDTIKKIGQLPEIKKAKLDGWLIEEMVPSGLELAIGAYEDPLFGHILMLGFGGIYIELFKDVSFRICPITRHDAEEMISELSTAAMLDGFRGGPIYDKESIVEALLKVGGEEGLLTEYKGSLSELDINPLIHTGTDLVAVDARFIFKSKSLEAVPKSLDSLDKIATVTLEDFEPLLYPKNVAVLGASARNVRIANTFIRRLKEFGFQGEIYPIHPTANKVEGLEAYKRIDETPTDIDYAYIAIATDRVAEAIDIKPGSCKFAQVISAGFDETEEGVEKLDKLLKIARKSRIRILGPNCLGTYSPRGKLTFPKDAPTEGGSIAVISQSGGLSTDIIKRGQWRGLRFSSLVTLGNSADVTPVELLKYYFLDEETKAIGLYVEDIKSGRALFETLRGFQTPKPVVILRGGVTEQGQQAAQSHTGAIASSQEPWIALSAQTGVVLVDTVDEFVNVLLALQELELQISRPTRNVVLFGNGGGSSVLGADAFARYDLDINSFSEEVKEQFNELKLPPGNSLLNPVDTPVATLQEKDGFIAKEILEIIYGAPNVDAIAMH